MNEPSSSTTNPQQQQQQRYQQQTSTDPSGWEIDSDTGYSIPPSSLFSNSESGTIEYPSGSIAPSSETGGYTTISALVTGIKSKSTFEVVEIDANSSTLHSGTNPTTTLDRISFPDGMVLDDNYEDRFHSNPYMQGVSPIPEDDRSTALSSLTNNDLRYQVHPSTVFDPFTNVMRPPPLVTLSEETDNPHDASVNPTGHFRGSWGAAVKRSYSNDAKDTLDEGRERKNKRLILVGCLGLLLAIIVTVALTSARGGAEYDANSVDENDERGVIRDESLPNACCIEGIEVDAMPSENGGNLDEGDTDAPVYEQIDVELPAPSIFQEAEEEGEDILNESTIDELDESVYLASSQNNDVFDNDVTPSPVSVFDSGLMDNIFEAKGGDRTEVPTEEPSPFPSPQPTTLRPTRNPTPKPTQRPTREPRTRKPSNRPTPRPTRNPVIVLTAIVSTEKPTEVPSRSPVKFPTFMPSPSLPTLMPSEKPTEMPTEVPTKRPTKVPTTRPTARPTTRPTSRPSAKPTDEPTEYPTPSPTDEPSPMPSPQPSPFPIPLPTATATPTFNPVTDDPTRSPVDSPTTAYPTKSPTLYPITSSPTEGPTNDPTDDPTKLPSIGPIFSPSESPTPAPSDGVTMKPTNTPTLSPISTPTNEPSIRMTPQPSPYPILSPSEGPTDTPSNKPTPAPTLEPSPSPVPPPSPEPTHLPTMEPTPGPTYEPTPQPSPAPFPEPTPQPTPAPVPEPTPQPSPAPFPEPTPQPSPAPVPEPEPTPQPSTETTPEPTPSPILEATPEPTPVTSACREQFYFSDEESLCTNSESGEGAILYDSLNECCNVHFGSFDECSYFDVCGIYQPE